MGPNGDDDYAGRDPDVAFNESKNEYLIVWEGDHNQSPFVDDEFEIWMRRIFGHGSMGGQHRISDIGGEGSSLYGANDPAVAYNPDQDEWLIVWWGNEDYSSSRSSMVEESTLPVGKRDDLSNGFAPSDSNKLEIFGQFMGYTPAGLITPVGANDFRISDNGPTSDPNFDAVAADVAYDPTNSKFLVVWHGDDDTGEMVNNEFEIFGQLIHALMRSEIGQSDIRLSDMGPDGSVYYRADFPAVAFSPTSGNFLVAWHGEDNIAPLTNDEFEIFGQRFNQLLSTLFLPITLENN
jgi:hypothetical protein